MWNIFSSDPCEDDQILCRDNSGCIYEDYFCDTTNDCSDGSDEEGCRGKKSKHIESKQVEPL